MYGTGVLSLLFDYRVCGTTSSSSMDNLSISLYLIQLPGLAVRRGQCACVHPAHVLPARGAPEAASVARQLGDRVSGLLVRGQRDRGGRQEEEKVSILLPVRPLYNTSIKLVMSPLSMLNLQKVLLVHLKKCVFYTKYELNCLCASPLNINSTLGTH